ncbi:MAG TPA: hypothetical protein VK826_00570 [Bacteroidia bacterium]|nr:hypothetical protein [Bacteroidia bacterium]
MKRAEHPTATFEFNNSILLVTVREDVELTADDVRVHHEIGQTLTGGVPHCALFRGSANSSATKDAMKYSAYNIPPGRKAEAILVTSLAIRLIGNFFVRFYKPNIPIKLFDNEADALNWLQVQLEAHTIDK